MSGERLQDHWSSDLLFHNYSYQIFFLSGKIRCKEPVEGKV